MTSTVKHNLKFERILKISTWQGCVWLKAEDINLNTKPAVEFELNLKLDVKLGANLDYTLFFYFYTLFFYFYLMCGTYSVLNYESTGLNKVTTWVKVIFRGRFMFSIKVP